MANVALSALLGGGVKSVQTDWVSDTGDTDAGEDSAYLDVTLATAVDPAKTVCFFVGGASSNSSLIRTKSFYTNTTTINNVYEVTARVTGTNPSTTLRLASASTTMAGRYYVIEYY